MYLPYSHLSQHRAKLYGIAALLIILFHSNSLQWKPLELFKYGYIGVDIFLFIGGFCLCYSIQKYKSLREFYLKRFLRIYPVWFVVAILVPTIVTLFRGGEWNLAYFVKLVYSSFVVLPLYTGRGGLDWFTTCLLHLYLLFPLFWWWARRFGSVSLYVIIFFVSFFLVSFVSLQLWERDCCISRIPVFVLGIVVYQAINGNSKVLIIPLLLSAVGGAISWINDYMFLKTAMICPFIVAFLCFLFDIIARNAIVVRCLRPLEALGKRSLEAYYGPFQHGIFASFFSASLWGAIIYVSTALFLTYLCAIVNDLLNPLREYLYKKLK